MGDVFVRDLKRHATTRIGGGNGTSSDTSRAVLSGSGRFVAFISGARDFTGADEDGSAGLFRRDLKTGATLRLPDGFPSSLSDNGNIVVFGTFRIAVHDIAANTTTRVIVGNGGQPADAGSVGVAISGDGRFAGFSTSATNLVSGDTNDTQDVFVRGPLGP